MGIAKLDWLKTALLDQASWRLRTLDTLGWKLADELRNPLAAIRGLSDLIARSAGSTAGADRTQVALLRRARMLQEQVARLEQRLDDYLLHRQPAVPPEPRPTDLRPLLGGVLEVIAAPARRKRIQLPGPLEAPLHALVDPAQLLQVLLSLAVALLEALPVGSRLERSVARTAAGQVRIVMTVTPGQEEPGVCVGAAVEDVVAPLQALLGQQGGSLEYHRDAMDRHVLQFELPGAPVGPGPTEAP